MLRFLKYSGTIVLALMMFILILPYFISLNTYKSDIILQVENALGRDFKIKGDIKFRILPRPYLKIKNIELSSVPDAQKPIMLSVEEIEVVLSILPLFVGKVEVNKLLLDSPEIILEKLENGKKNWEFAFMSTSKNKSFSIEKTKPTTPSSLSKTPPFHVKSIEIRKGKVYYIEDKKNTKIKDINLSIDIESFKGPVNFTLELKILDKTMDLVGRLETIGNQIPIEAKVKVLGEKFVVGGIIDLDSESFKGDFQLKGNLQYLKHFIPDFNLPDSLKKTYHMKSDIFVTSNNISFKNIDFNLPPLRAKGDVDIDLKKTIGKLKFDLMPGAVHLELRPYASTKKNEFSGKISLGAKNIYELLKVLKIETKKFPSDLFKSFSLTTEATYKDKKIEFRSIALNIGKAKLSGQFSIKNWDKNGKYIFDLKTNDLGAIAFLAGINLPKTVGPTKVKGEISGKSDDLKVDLSVYAANAQTEIKGHVFKKEKTIKPELSFVLSGKNLRSTLEHLGQKNVSKALRGFNLKVRMKGDIPQRIKCDIKKSYITVGRDRVGIKGDLDLFLAGIKPKVNANLALSSLNLDRLLTFDSSNKNKHIKLVAKKRRGNSASKVKNRWSHDVIDFGFLRSFDGNMNISIPKLQKGSLVFDTIKINTRIANGILDLTSLKGNLYGGSLTVKGRVSSQKQQPIILTAHLKNAQLKNIIPKQKEIKVLKGLFSLDVDLTTHGRSEYQYIANLAGSLNFRGEKGSISGFNIEKVVHDLKNVRDIGGALGLLDSAFSGGKTSFNSIVCAASISKGEARIKKFVLDAKGADISAEGSVNLLKYLMDIFAKVTLEAKGLPSFSVLIYGPLDNPKHKLKTGKLEQYLMKNVLQGVFDNISQGKGKTEDIIKGIFGLGKNKKTTPQQKQKAPQQQNKQPKDIDAIGEAVGGLLKELF